MIPSKSPEKLLLILLLVVFSSTACFHNESESGNREPVEPAYYVEDYPFRELTDCTDSRWSERTKAYFEDGELESQFAAVESVSDPLIKERALAAANTWAFENRYLPCSFEMCGMVTRTKSEGLMVYLHPPPGSIASEAMLAIDPTTYEVTDDLIYHSACYRL